MRTRATYWRLVSLLVSVLLSRKPVCAIKCYKTGVGSTPHLVDCGPHARACRIIVKPYKLQNNSAVSDCNDKQMVGRFVFDCVVECPEWHGDRHWNELDCCSSNNCNTGEELREQTRCYVSKGRDSSAYDEIQMCNKPDRCAVNIVTRETRCVTQRDCTSKLWACCRDEGCLNKWGVEKVTASSLEESSNAADLLPSAAPVLIGLIAQLVNAVVATGL
ncbi:hypothetical protein BOX15_Mlig026830g1 [Macrostomum lignano]|uniref:Activin_recp domain-containing protein n=1 Tax=Macrostomum lignano TaxID=282301 RepID=A0A267F482_9PLAT|nr:hypothetical protein BOX15_Mlig026830g1 [Macrostomum lignano]